MARDKFRIRFRKGGDLRLISHHDLMRCFERMLRRAAIPVHCSQGFHPKPRIVFALSLALGIVGCQEVAEIELDETVGPTSGPEELHRLLAREAPPGLDILSVKRVEATSRALLCRMTYRVPLSPAQAREVETQIPLILASPNCWTQRAKTGARPIDLRASIVDLRLASGFLEFDLCVTPQGTARPEEILKLLGLADGPEEGSVIERTSLDLEDECKAPTLDRCAAPGSSRTQLEGSS